MEENKSSWLRKVAWKVTKTKWQGLDLCIYCMTVYLRGECVCVFVSPVSDQMDFSNIFVYFKRRLKDPQRWWQSLDGFQPGCFFLFINPPKKNTHTHTQTHTHTHTHTLFLIPCCMAAGWLRLMGVWCLLSYHHFHRSSLGNSDTTLLFLHFMISAAVC